MTTAMVTVQINDNTEYKHNSFDFTLSIISDILSSNIIIGETGQTTVIIIDDECKSILKLHNQILNFLATNTLDIRTSRL